MIDSKMAAAVEILSLLHDATDDECSIALAFTRKLMGEGRTEHGALDLATDSRTVDDLLREAVDEGLDAVSYVLMAQLKARMEATRLKPYVWETVLDPRPSGRRVIPVVDALSQEAQDLGAYQVEAVPEHIPEEVTEPCTKGEERPAAMVKSMNCDACPHDRPIGLACDKCPGGYARRSVGRLG